MKALYNIPYGVYVLTAKGEKQNGCIINTLLQVTSSPVKISITVNKDNYTTKLIEQTGVFNVSILDMTTSFDIIKHFGFASGRDVNKFDNFYDYKLADNGVAYITKHTNSYLSAKVVSKTDVGTHVTFVAEVTADVVLDKTDSLLYSYYQSNIKPKAGEHKKTVWICKVCGYVYEGEEIPEDFVCPLCKHGAADFEKKEAPSNEPAKVESKPAGSKNKFVCPICGYSQESEADELNCIICGAKMNKV